VGRLKAACNLVSQYVPENICKLLLASYEYVSLHPSQTYCFLTLVVSFSSLDAHLKSLQEETAALVAADMNSMEVKESKSTVSEKANKKRKAASTGVEKLKKVNTKGMAKLSSFFQPKTSA
jgi:ribonuclease H2 subunit B